MKVKRRDERMEQMVGEEDRIKGSGVGVITFAHRYTSKTQRAQF